MKYRYEVDSKLKKIEIEVNKILLSVPEKKWLEFFPKLVLSCAFNSLFLRFSHAVF